MASQTVNITDNIMTDRWTGETYQPADLCRLARALIEYHAAPACDREEDNVPEVEYCQMISNERTLFHLMPDLAALSPRQLQHVKNFIRGLCYGRSQES